MTNPETEWGQSDKNRKISERVKSEFIYLVTKNNFSMKNAAKKCLISYSTAKKIFAKFRLTLKKCELQETSKESDSF